jgi:hypothetical protein
VYLDLYTYCFWWHQAEKYARQLGEASQSEAKKEQVFDTEHH